MAHDHDDELDAWLADDNGEPVNVDEDPPTIVDDEGVDRTLRKIARLRRDQQRIVDAHERKIAEITARLDDLTHGIAAAITWHERSVLGYAAKAFDGAPSAVRTINLPSGDLMRRKQKNRVADTPVLIAEQIAGGFPALAQPGPVKVNKTVVAALCHPAPSALGVPDAEGFAPHQAMLRHTDPATGEVTDVEVPGLLFLVPTTDKITYKEK